MGKLWVIYALRRVRVLYIGRSFDLKRRLREHRKSFGQFECDIIESGSGDDYGDAEQRWIKHFLASGAMLENKTAGGNGGRWLSAESRRKVSLALKGRPVTWGEKIASAQKGKQRDWSADGLTRVQATQFKKGRRAAFTGADLSADARKRIGQKISSILVGNQYRSGIPHSDASKERIAQSVCAAWQSGRLSQRARAPRA